MIDDQLKWMIIEASESGKIHKVIRPGFNLEPQDLSGLNLLSSVGHEYRIQLMDIILDARHFGFTTSNLVKIPAIDPENLLHLSAFFYDYKIILVISSKAVSISDIIENTPELDKHTKMRMMNHIRQDMKMEDPEEPEHLNEITRFNNELINLQRSLHKKNHELERLNQLKNQFLGMAAHDLRNPLSIISGYSQLLKRMLKNGDEQVIDMLDLIHQRAIYMERLINDFLDISVIESGNLKLNLEQFNVVKAIEQTILMNKLKAESKGIEIIFKNSLDELYINADKIKIEQVLNNLIQNAIKFSFPKSQISVGLSLETNYLKIWVQDHGKGLNKQQIKDIFYPFNASHSKGTSGEEGTGLGLSISKKIIKAHEGELWVDSCPDKGATFYFTLPAKS